MTLYEHVLKSQKMLPPVAAYVTKFAYSFTLVLLCASDKDEELSSRVEELMEKFMDIVVSDPQQKELAEEVEQRKKFLKKNGGVHRKIVTG